MRAKRNYEKSLIAGICLALNIAISESDRSGAEQIFEATCKELGLTIDEIKEHCEIEYDLWKEYGLIKEKENE